MTQFESQLNELLVDTFHTILKVEEKIIKNVSSVNLTINELHLIEAVGESDQPKTISELSGMLSISLPSVTIAVNKLVQKGFLQKEKSATDKRSVTICLTHEGARINKLHHYFHYKMIKQVSAKLTEDEQNSMISGIEKLNSFFAEKSRMMED